MQVVPFALHVLTRTEAALVALKARKCGNRARGLFWSASTMRETDGESNRGRWQRRNNRRLVSTLDLLARVTGDPVRWKMDEEIKMMAGGESYGGARGPHQRQGPLRAWGVGDVVESGWSQRNNPWQPGRLVT